jgi:hypothetical protein
MARGELASRATCPTATIHRRPRLRAPSAMGKWPRAIRRRTRGALLAGRVTSRMASPVSRRRHFARTVTRAKSPSSPPMRVTRIVGGATAPPLPTRPLAPPPAALATRKNRRVPLRAIKRARAVTTHMPDNRRRNVACATRTKHPHCMVRSQAGARHAIGLTDQVALQRHPPATRAMRAPHCPPSTLRQGMRTALYATCPRTSRRETTARHARQAIAMRIVTTISPRLWSARDATCFSVDLRDPKLIAPTR